MKASGWVFIDTLEGRKQNLHLLPIGCRLPENVVSRFREVIVIVASWWRGATSYEGETAARCCKTSGKLLDDIVGSCLMILEEVINYLLSFPGDITVALPGFRRVTPGVL